MIGGQLATLMPMKCQPVMAMECKNGMDMLGARHRSLGTSPPGPCDRLCKPVHGICHTRHDLLHSFRSPVGSQPRLTPDRCGEKRNAQIMQGLPLTL